MDERFAKEVLIARYSPNERLVQLLVKMKDAVGALADVNRITAGESVDLRQSITYSVPKEYAVYSAFAAVKKGYELSVLLGKLRQSPFVIEARAVDGVDGSVVDTLLFPVNFARDRVVVLEARAVVSMFEAIQQNFGTGGSVIMYQLGHYYGHSLFDKLAASFTPAFMAKNHAYGLKILGATGWGIPEIMSENDTLTKVAVQVKECFLCEKSRVKGRAGYFMAGVLAGAFSFLSGRELLATEEKCIANGDDICEFSVYPEGAHARQGR